MLNCIENFYDEIIKIEAIPMREASFAHPFALPLMSMAQADVTIGDAAKIMEVLHEDGTAKAEAKFSDGVSGRYATVTVSFTQEQHTTAAFTQMSSLSRKAHHLRLTTLDGKVMFVRTLQDSYKFIADQQDGKYQCVFTIQNVNGIQDFV